MRTQFLLTACVSSFLLLPSAFAQGSLTPPAGAPTATMRSLDQIYNRLDTRTPISSVPFTISASGSYYLTTNVTVSSGDAITVSANNVTLDLNGYTISSTAASANGSAILLNSSRTNVAIYNGHINSSVTNSSSGVFGGGGFASGIVAGSSGYNVRVKDVSVIGVLNYGILLYTGNATIVQGCTVNIVGSYGIDADDISDSSAQNCGSYGILGTTASNCKGGGLGSGYGVSVNTADNCFGTSSGSGSGVATTTANNCIGFSASGYGLYAFTANNCYGQSSSGTGLYAVSMASGCNGYSPTGTGLNAFIASVCRGQSTSGITLLTTHNINSF